MEGTKAPKPRVSKEHFASLFNPPTADQPQTARIMALRLKNQGKELASYLDSEIKKADRLGKGSLIGELQNRLLYEKRTLEITLPQCDVIIEAVQEGTISEAQATTFLNKIWELGKFFQKKIKKSNAKPSLAP
ncbi:MAG: hypothetical protein V1493_03570 [Candidatus Diapherotrites archaeon]